MCFFSHPEREREREREREQFTLAFVIFGGIYQKDMFISPMVDSEPLGMYAVKNIKKHYISHFSVIIGSESKTFLYYEEESSVTEGHSRGIA